LLVAEVLPLNYIMYKRHNNNCDAYKYT
jgi:hypothetical protein